jgi:hypothetical protein
MIYTRRTSDLIWERTVPRGGNREPKSPGWRARANKCAVSDRSAYGL